MLLKFTKLKKKKVDIIAYVQITEPFRPKGYLINVFESYLRIKKLIVVLQHTYNIKIFGLENQTDW